jgi:calcineurin-like phosphoesterase family protein/purple acid phosphatase-like protein/type IX secretion system substrate protein
MGKLLICFLLMLTFILNSFGQTILVEPYLQDAEPASIQILWETDGGTSGSIEWGTDFNNLNQSESASSTITSGANLLYLAKLSGLSANTRYYYRTVTDGTSSITYDFISPPLKSSEQSFNLVAMSDMQKDGAQPFKFQEVVHDGILDYFETEYGEDDIAEHLGFVMIPGDLVQNGNSYTQWQNDFFGQSNPLFSKVPVYPVLGNHENNSSFYFQYFALPQNGSPGYFEHWWYKDYSNVRIIGLNSNSGYQIQAQLDWLNEVLDEACEDVDIDFVFAQLHHPFKSELWTPGELSYTGGVIEILENFSSDCGKPSIHFFGHTHAYSRGQSRDHNHLWVNAATAGGAIDNWGEFPNQDYEEFSKSIDDYGFVVLNVDAGNDPQFVLKRITRGDQDNIIDNEQQDIITIKKNETAPQQPTGLFPFGNDISPDCFIMQADGFNDSGDFHQASHWQVSTDCNNFSNPVFDSWKQHENWYDEIDTQNDDDLTNEEGSGLEENTDYCWRVRYRDEHLKWSEWSLPLSFQTGDSGLSPNLIANPDAENGVNNWTIETGIIESLSDGQCAGEAPHTGIFYFAVGGLCDGNETAYSEVYQTVDVSAYADKIDQGMGEAIFGGYLSNYSGSDMPAMSLEFLDANDNVLAPSIVLSTTNDNWTLLENNEVIPALTRSIKVILTGTRNSGTDNDSYFDDLFLQVDTIENVECSEAPLPVDLFSFEATCFERFISLSWQVAREADIKVYEMERSLNGRDWENAGTMYPSSSNQLVKLYEFRDFNRSKDHQNYYRIKILEEDQSFYYSKIVTDNCAQLRPEIKLFPNPVFGDLIYLDITGFSNTQAEIRVNNLLGQEVYFYKTTLKTGANKFSIQLASWTPGYYNVTVNTAQWQWAGKLIRQ